MGLFSSIGSFVSRAATSIASAAKRTFETAKKFVGKAVEFLANKAENIIENIKKTWKRVKPYVEKLHECIKVAAKYAPFPWLKMALTTLDKGLEALFAFENSPIGKKIEEAIQWAIKIARRLQDQKNKNIEEETKNTQEDSVLSEAEIHTAKQHQANVRAAEDKLQATGLSHEIALITAVNDFEIAKADISKVINEAPSNFEHFLRLRATQKLLKMSEKTFRAAKQIDDISADEIFLVRVASDLIKEDPELSEMAAIRLDSILQTKYGKKLTPFVFEEMVASWANSAEAEEQRWSALNRTLIKDRMLEKNLLVSKKIQGDLAVDEENELKKLGIEIPEKQTELDNINIKKLDIDRYVGAAEGFLQLLEKEEQEIIDEGNDFLITDSPIIGELLIRCAEQQIPFSELKDEEQDLIRDYSNIFKKDSRKRMQSVLTVAA